MLNHVKIFTIAYEDINSAKKSPKKQPKQTKPQTI